MRDEGLLRGRGDALELTPRAIRQMGASALADVSFPQAGYAALAAFFGPFAGRLCMMNSAHYLEARITTLATLAAPPLTLVLAFVILGDLPSTREIQGGLLMLVGISIPILGSARRPDR